MRKREDEDAESDIDYEEWTQVAQDPFSTIINRIDTVFFFFEAISTVGWMHDLFLINLPQKK